MFVDADGIASAQADAAAAQRSVRDLMGLLALPALWSGRDTETVLQLTTEAIERIVDLDLTYVDVHFQSEQPPFSRLRVRGVTETAERLDKWQEALHALHQMPLSSAACVQATPLGALRVVRLSMGYTNQNGSIWFGSLDPAFPLLAQSASMRAAATLAAVGLQSARIEHAREVASRAKDEFLAMLGHELRNPLAPIFTALELLKLQATGPLSPAHAIIERQARHLSRLVDDLLDVSRIARGKVELDSRRIDIRSIIVNAIEAVTPLIAQRFHNVASTLPDAPLFVVGDATRLTQIFVMLLTNAAKYTASRGHIGVEVLVDAERVSICISDDGSGISAELLPRLFNIFEQGSSTIDRSGGGLGIGLALVQSFVRLHGGTVTAVSDGLGKGSKFTVTLPLAPDVIPDQVHSQIARPSGGVVAVPRGLRVMLVDDNVDAIETMAEMLRSSGFQVVTALDPFQALVLAASFEPNVAIVDIGLPGMDGRQLAAELRRRAGNKPLRLLALSGYGTADDIRRSAGAGFERHLVKPVNADGLVALLSDVQ